MIDRRPGRPTRAQPRRATGGDRATRATRAVAC
jgi:hypothetical protein